MKKVIREILLGAIILSASIISAQNSEIDSLEKQLLISDQDTNRVFLLNTLAYKLHTSNPEKGNHYAKESIALATQLGFDKGRAHAYNSLGAGLWNQGELDSALSFYTKSYQLNDTLGNVRGVTGALSNMAIIFNNQGDYPKSIEFYTKALAEMEANGFDSYVAITSNNLGLVLQRLGRYSEALEYFHRAIKMGEPLEMANLVGPAWINVGRVYKDIGELEKQKEALEAAIEIGEKSNSKYVLALSYNNFGRYYEAKEEFKKALKYFKRALAINTEVGRKRSISSNLINIGSTYRKLGLYDSSLYSIEKAKLIVQDIQHNTAVISTYYQMGLTLMKKQGCNAGIPGFLQGYSLAKETGEIEYLRDISKSLAECYSSLGNYKEAFKYQEEFMVAQDSMINEKQIKDLAQVEANYEFESQLSEKDNEIILLAAKEEVSQLRLFLGLGGALVILVIGIFIARNKLKARELQNEHFRELGKFKEAMTGMIAHDLKNPLGIILSTESEKPSTRQMAKQMLNLISNMLDVHKFESTEVTLSPYSISLEQAITKATEQVRPLLSQKNITIQTSMDSDFYVYADNEYLLRVFVNLFTNAIKYSPNNGKIEVLASKIGEAVQIEVIDHGSGIAPENLGKIFKSFGQVDPKESGGIVSTGLGLSFCQLAIRAHGSELEVKSQQGVGTNLKFSLKFVNELHIQKSALTEEFVFIIPREERNQILSKLPQLREMKLHDAFAIEEILKGIETRNQEVLDWSNRVIDAAYANNEVYYEELLNLAENIN